MFSGDAGEGFFGDHAGFDAEGLCGGVGPGDFSFAEAFEGADGVFGGAFDDGSGLAVGLTGVDVDSGAGEEAFWAGDHEYAEGRPSGDDAFDGAVFRLVCSGGDFHRVFLDCRFPANAAVKHTSIRV